jgi:hypothetical protein
MTLDQAPGVECADDPTLHARTAPCAVSLSRRLQWRDGGAACRAAVAPPSSRP